MAVSTEIAKDSTVPVPRKVLAGLESFFSQFGAEPPAPWNTTTIAALVSLVAIWAAWFYGTWAYWGNLTIDCGREMYVPAVLAEGKTLYRDVWFNFGPVSPYFNSFLFRLFGVHLNILYWGGSLAALGSAILLFLSGMQLSYCFAGWTTAAVLLCESFHPSIFCFPLPYSYASVYGCFVTCAFLWLAIRACQSTNRIWIFASGWAAATAVLLKPEFGIGCSVALLLFIAARAAQTQSWKPIPKDLLAILPAALTCAAVIVWMITLRGASFITQENLQSWPTAYFMRAYGKLWLKTTGLSLSGGAFAKAAGRTLIFFGVLQGFLLFFHWKQEQPGRTLLRMLVFAGALLAPPVYLMANPEFRHAPKHLVLRETLRYFFFPQDVVLYLGVAAALAWWFYLRQPDPKRNPALPLLLTVSVLISVRILLKNLPWDYPIFFNGPIVFSFLLLVSALFPPVRQFSRFAFRGGSLICAGCLLVALMYSRRPDHAERVVVPLTTERGTVRVSPSRAEQYRAAIRLMQEKSAHGEYVLSVPEDTSLYFLSGTSCPSRVFAFTPGLVAPGEMTEELIKQVDAKNVRWLLWSNREFREYGVPRFGVDFDKTFAQYLTSHYHLIGPLDDPPADPEEWRANIWERNRGD